MKKVLKILPILFLLVSCNKCKDPVCEVDDKNSLNFYCLEQSGSYGDSTLYKYGDIEILVDFGTAGVASELCSLLQEKVTDHKIELLVSSHPHSDHYAGLSYGSTNTLKAAGIERVDYIVDSGTDNAERYSNYGTYWINQTRNYYLTKGARYKSVQDMVLDHHDDAVIKLDRNLEVQFLDTEHYYDGGSAGNDESVAMVIKYKNYNIFTFGDLPKASESGILKYDNKVLYDENDINILKASHHGSNGANSDALIAKIKPSYCWASSGIIGSNQSSKGVSEQHPYNSCSRRIVAITTQAHYYWTGTMGSIRFTLSNDKVEVHGFGRKNADYYYQGQLVDPNEEKDLPFYKTKFAKINAYR